MTEAGWTRERKLVDELLTFIEATSGRKLKFLTIANLNTGETEDPQDRIAAWLKRHLDADRQQGRVAAFKESIEKLREREKFYTEQEAISEGQMRLTRGLQRNESSGCIHELEKLAQQAQDEKGVGDAQ